MRRAPARRTIEPAGRWRAAFAGVMAALFADEGLLFFDPRDAPRRARWRRRFTGRRSPGRAAIEAAPDRARRGAGGGGLRRADPRARPDCALLLLPPRRRGGRPLPAGATARAGTRWGLSGRDATVRRPTLEAALATRAAARSRPRRCCGRSCRTRCCRPPPTSAARPRSATSPSSGRSTTRFGLTAAAGRSRGRASAASTRARAGCSTALGLHAGRRRAPAPRSCWPLGRGGAPPRARMPRRSPRTVARARSARSSTADAPTVEPPSSRRPTGTSARAAARTRATVARALDRLTDARYARTLAARDEVAARRASRGSRRRCAPAACRRSAPTAGRRWPAGSARRAQAPGIRAPAARRALHHQPARPRGREPSRARFASASPASPPSAAAASSPPRSRSRSPAAGHARSRLQRRAARAASTDASPAASSSTRSSSPAYPQLRHSLYTLALASKIVEVARREHLDLVHAHYALPHAASAYLARQVLARRRRRRAPRIVTTLHGTDITLVGSDPSFLPLTRFSILESDAVTAPSAGSPRRRAQTLDLPAQRADRRRPELRRRRSFAPAPGGPRGATRPRRCSFTSRTSGRSSASTTWSRSSPACAPRGPARLRLVGDGPERARAVAELAPRCGLAGDVELLGERLDLPATSCAAPTCSCCPARPRASAWPRWRRWPAAFPSSPRTWAACPR